MAKKCPLLGKKCITHECEFYTHLVGINPQTGQETDNWGCPVNFIPLLLIEVSSRVRQATASTDKVATEVAVHRQVFVNALNDESRARLLNADSQMRIERRGE